MKTPRLFRGWTIPVSASILVMALVTGCMGSYGRLKRDTEVLQAFENMQVPTDYRYFYYGFDTRPYVVIGVESKYEAGSNMWREIEADTERFKNMLTWIWEDFGYSRYGAQILDPEGNQVGILYSSINVIAIKFSGGNRIIVMPHTPFLWGPGADEGSSRRIYSQKE